MPDLLVIALAVIALYSASLVFWPYTSCGRCHGAGKHRSPSGKAWRNCPRCKGTGRKERLGRKLMR